ncbi:hypothetical protein SNEBB_004367 [Seison nebaliae]|nr:hypothetical protein SNEBB_004367 [Seison nebaliae]
MAFSSLFFAIIGYILVQCSIANNRAAAFTLFKSLTIIVFSAFLYFSFGYAFSYSIDEKHSSNGFLGYRGYFGEGIENEKDDTNINNLRQLDMSRGFFIVITTALAALTPILDRITLIAIIAITSLLAGFVQPVTMHWIEHSKGWLHSHNSKINNVTTTLSFQDEGFSCEIFFIAAIIALIGLIIGGNHRQEKQRTPHSTIIGHNFPLYVLGILFIFFNIMSNSSNQGKVVLSAISCALIYFLFYSIVKYVLKKKYRFPFIRTEFAALLCGAITIASSTKYIPYYGAALIGLVTAFLFITTLFLLDLLKTDDDSFLLATHLCGGIVGTLFVPFTNNFDASTLYSWRTFGWQLGGLIGIFGWIGIFFLLLFFLLLLLKQLRSPLTTQSYLVDDIEFNEPAYLIEDPRINIESTSPKNSEAYGKVNYQYQCDQVAFNSLNKNTKSHTTDSDHGIVPKQEFDQSAKHHKKKHRRNSVEMKNF